MVRQKSASCQLNTVNYDTADGTATVADGDYVAASVTVTVLPGVTSQPVTGTDNCAPPFEPNETFFVNLSNPVNATISDNQGAGTIVNDDGQPTISDRKVTQMKGSDRTMLFTVMGILSSASFKTITVNYATADDTVTVADGDYVAVRWAVTVLPWVTSQPFGVPLDVHSFPTRRSSDLVNLSNPVNATISDNQGVGTIVNDDGQPTI